ncbi:phosphatidylserine decarboxylase [Candidatus Dependentiae bacterium]|nr:phosphatidylserine decarboxylase [Candidatus Dependentiae bacterium]
MYLKNFLIILIFFSFIFIILLLKKDKYKKGNCYYNQKNELVCENIEAVSGLNFLYNNTLGKIFRIILKRKIVSKIFSWYQKSSFSKSKIKPFIRKHSINVSEFLLPVEKFKSFNDFFIRKLKPDARTIEGNKGDVVSPADSKLFVIQNISKEINFFVKNKNFNLRTFIKDKFLSDKYEGGQMLIFRLAPPDYHRYHFPFDCFASDYKVINGVLESVNPIAYKSGVQPLYENERQLIKLKSDSFGDVLFVVVGAMLVGKIIHTYKPNKEHKKGEEFGYFEFGGSSIVMLFEKDKIKIKQKFLDNSANGYETQVLMGQVITE